jgi:hypothetical protein
MRRSSKEQFDKLERALARAHELQEPPRLSRGWVDSIMREVRRRPVGVTPLLEMPLLVWRAAAVVVLVSLIFVGSVLTWNAGRADADFTALFAEAGVDATLTGEP